MDMQAVRGRFASLLEWVAAAIVLAAVVALASVVVREVRTVTTLTPVIAGESLPDASVPAGVPSRAVSVPVLLLSNGAAIRVGESPETVAGKIGGATEVRPRSIERAVNGQRITYFYEVDGTQFVLLFEPFERGGSLRLAAIYIP